MSVDDIDIRTDEEFNSFLEKIKDRNFVYEEKNKIFKSKHIKDSWYTIGTIEDFYSVKLNYIHLKTLEEDILKRRDGKEDSCPMCGNKDFIFEFENGWGNNVTYKVKCKECKTIGYSYHDKKGIRWESGLLCLTCAFKEKGSCRDDFSKMNCLKFGKSVNPFSTCRFVEFENMEYYKKE